jgi:hypothetical protein
LGELNGSAQGRWLKSVEVFNEQGEAQQLKLFPSHVEVPDDDPQVALSLPASPLRIRHQIRCAVCRCFRGAFLSPSRTVSLKFIAGSSDNVRYFSHI